MDPRTVWLHDLTKAIEIEEYPSSFLFIQLKVIRISIRISVHAIPLRILLHFPLNEQRKKKTV